MLLNDLSLLAVDDPSPAGRGVIYHLARREGLASSAVAMGSVARKRCAETPVGSVEVIRRLRATLRNDLSSLRDAVE
jgi:hypothetical protein